jgi:hypothetical protein
MSSVAPDLGAVLAEAHQLLALSGVNESAAPPNPALGPRVPVDVLADLVKTVEANDVIMDAVGAREACDILEVASGNLYRLVGLPKEAKTLAVGKLWRGRDIHAFARTPDQRRRMERAREKAAEGESGAESLPTAESEAQARRAAAAE